MAIPSLPACNGRSALASSRSFGSREGGGGLTTRPGAALPCGSQQLGKGANLDGGSIYVLAGSSRCLYRMICAQRCPMTVLSACSASGLHRNRPPAKLDSVQVLGCSISRGLQHKIFNATQPTLPVPLLSDPPPARVILSGRTSSSTIFNLRPSSVGIIHIMII